MSNPNKLCTDVLVVGAGPAGLTLASELQLQGVSVTLIDRKLESMKESRALGLTLGALEHLLSRGQLGKFGTLQGRDSVHFAGIPLSTSKIASDLSPAIEIPQYRTEEVLTQWLREVGGHVDRGWELVEFSENSDCVTSIISDTDNNLREITSKYIVGCDGSKSKVRSLAELDFSLSDPSVQMLLGDFLETDLPNNPFGVKTDKGMVMSGPIGDGAVRVIVAEFEAPFWERGKNLTGNDISDAYERVVGERFSWDALHWGSSFTDASGMAEQFTKGRAILIGDAAHLHLPAGGQGMNVSILDAANLGWKLAQVIKNHSLKPLESFEAERKEAAVELLTNTQSQGQLFLKGKEVDPLRDMFKKLLQEPRSAYTLAQSVSSLGVRYKFEYASDDDCIGFRALSGNFPDIPWQEKLSGIQKSGNWLFVSTPEVDKNQEACIIQSKLAHIKTNSIICESPDDFVNRKAVLLRPDGFIAWEDQSAIPIKDILNYWDIK